MEVSSGPLGLYRVSQSLAGRGAQPTRTLPRVQQGHGRPCREPPRTRTFLFQLPRRNWNSGPLHEVRGPLFQQPQGPETGGALPRQASFGVCGGSAGTTAPAAAPCTRQGRQSRPQRLAAAHRLDTSGRSAARERGRRLRRCTRTAPRPPGVSRRLGFSPLGGGTVRAVGSRWEGAGSCCEEQIKNLSPVAILAQALAQELFV